MIAKHEKQVKSQHRGKFKSRYQYRLQNTPKKFRHLFKPHSLLV